MTAALISTAREERAVQQDSDGRSPFQRDRDRILYTDEFRRLAGITQVISPHDHSFHNRLTHTLEVAQIGRRMAEYVLADPQNKSHQIEQYLDADVVEAACLAHDLGHPPFGHVAEKELDQLGRGHGGTGFEGNAHSFRIVTRLALYSKQYQGLNLTRATLNAILKYPWLRDADENSSRHRKFGAYESDLASFDFARYGFQPHPLEKPQSLEAQIMDHADAIAYAVHDLFDFFRAGLLPMPTLMTEDGLHAFFNHPKNEQEILKDTPLISREDALRLLREDFPCVFEPYDGRREQRLELKRQASLMINRYVSTPSVDWTSSYPVLKIPSEHLLEINFLKRVIWHYIIDRPQLGTQQHGMRRIIQGLFNTYLTEIQNEKPDVRIIPQALKHEYDIVRDNKDKPAQVRLAVDIVAGLSDGQALEMYKRLMGVDPGKITDFIAT